MLLLLLQQLLLLLVLLRLRLLLLLLLLVDSFCHSNCLRLRLKMLRRRLQQPSQRVTNLTNSSI